MDLFLLKKIVSNATQIIPMSLLLLLAIALFTRHARAGALVIASLLLALASPPVSNAIVASLEDRYPPLAAPPANTRAITVLGYGHIESPQRSATSTLMAGALSRLREAVRLWHLAPASTLITSGGYLWQGSEQSHARAMADAAIEMGVDADKILLSDQAKDTPEEARRIKDLVGDGVLVVVTSATHIPRSVTLFRDQGFETLAAPADYLVRPERWWRFNAEFLHNVDRALHEYVGMAWYALSKP